MNKIKINTPKISVINNISTPPTFPRKYTLVNADSGSNVYLVNQYTPIIAPVIIPKDMTARLPTVGRFPTNKLGTRRVINWKVIRGTNGRRTGMRTQ